MRILLDTNAVIWSATKNRKLGRKASALIVDPVNEVLVSAVSGFEITLKSNIGRLKLRGLTGNWLPGEMEKNNFQPLPLTMEHALTAGRLPRLHFDPFDHMLIAQAQIEGLRLMTADTHFESYNLQLIDATE